LCVIESGKGEVRAVEEHKDKKERKLMSVLGKMEVLDELDRRISISAVGHHYGMKEFIIHFGE
jgi:hypothetical protein